MAAATRGADGLTGILKDAAIYALGAFALCVPVVSFRTDAGPTGGLELTPRWVLVAALCAAIFLARLAQRLVLMRRDARRALRPSRSQATEAVAGMPNAGQRVSMLALWLFIGVALTLPVVAALASGSLGEGRYWIDLGILILTYVMLGWGLNIVVGLAGLLDLGYVAFYAVGAYSYALLSTTFGLSFWICLPLAGLFAALWGMLLGFPVLRLRGDYLAIVTLAFGEIIRLVLINWVDVTGGGAGISSIPRATFFGIPFTAGEDGFAARFGLTFDSMHRVVFLYYLILALALITNVVTLRLRRLPIGRAWEALREDEIACRSLGINTTTTKLTAFALGAAFGGFAGSFFAVRQGFISPESFNFLESAIILAIVVLGGMGSQVGVAIAAVAMVGGPEMLRNLGFLKSIFGQGFDPNEYRLLLFGLAMVAMMVWRPRGLISERTPSVALGERRAISGAHVSEGHG
ncbi:high-affinity branched-chain amino acid ABC transporter permease LivM [Methylobacterium sp. WL116]|uniref:high-affinity branched-chain amino acid ABC transporter permease LivM n=1 Tax=Methylobacterium sp. WL116 TaxID=2603889 RepID=UPI0011C80FA3|nr:high-affinity branched-chain amino acid ABC transporter permease LivM [Methylobacterium sp. WL116]TXM94126.1 high-affinity branched-chain amino acid ABC transporter permease LivM [Methylobacterium sp. WL116]